MRPERFTAWILATALCAAAPAVQGAPDAATRTSTATPLSLQDARTRLLQVSDQLAAARAAVESKRLQTQGLQGLGGPIVGLSASHTRYSLHGELDLAEAKQEIGNRLSELGPLLPALGPLAQPVGQLATRLPQAIPDALPYHLKGTRNSQAISAVWPVYTGGATQAVKDFSAAQQDEAQADAQATTHQLEDTLVQRYFGVQLARRAVALRQQAASTIAEHDHAAERLLQVGMIARVDRLQASVALEQARREQLKAQGDLALAQAALQSLLHSEQAVQPSTPLFVDTRPLPPLEQFRQLALGHHPGLDKVAAKKAQAEQLHALENSRWKPTVALFGRRELQRNNASWVAGVQAHWTLWSSVDRHSMQQAAAQKIIQAERTDAQVRSDITLLVEKNWRAVDDARQQYLSLTPSVQLAQEMMRLRSSGLREGTSTMIDLIDAHTQYTRVETERAKAAHDYVLALSRLLDSAGVPEQFDQYAQRADVRLR